MLIVLAILLGVAAELWAFLPPISMLGWWAFLFTGGQFEQWWYELPDGRRTEWLYELGTGASYLVLPITISALFLLYTRRLWDGASAVGPRTWIPAVALFGASAWYIAINWQYAIKFQGLDFMTRYLAASAGTLLALAAAYVWVRRKPTWRGSLAFHLGVFAWLVILAFPWLGEYI